MLHSEPVKLMETLSQDWNRRKNGPLGGKDANLFSLLLDSLLLLRVLLQLLLSSIYGSMPLLPLLRVVCYSLHGLLQCTTHTVMLPPTMIIFVATHSHCYDDRCVLAEICDLETQHVGQQHEPQ